MSQLFHTFEARALHPDLGNEHIAGTIRFTNLALRFESSTTVLEIPLQRLAVELEQTGNERVFFSDPEQPGLQVTSPDASVLDVRGIAQLTVLREERNVRLTRWEISRRVKLVLGVLAGCVLLWWLALLVTGLMVRSVVARITPEFEEQYGDSLFQDLKRKMAFVDDTNQNAQVASMAGPLLAALPPNRTQWRFHVITNESPNAFALPGGHIIVFTGLLSLAERPEEVAGTIAHEVAHVTQKHEFRQKIASAGPLLVFQVLLRGRGGALGGLAGGSALLVTQSFSQGYENEADEAGWRYLVAANIDPRGLTGMLRKLKDYEATQKTIDLLPQAFQTHPGLEKRIAGLEARWKKLPRKSGFIELGHGMPSEPSAPRG